MAVNRFRTFGDSMAEGWGNGNRYGPGYDPKSVWVYTTGRGLGLPDPAIINNGEGGSKVAAALARQKQTPAGGPGSLDVFWSGHNNIRNRTTSEYHIIQEVKDAYQTFYTYARSNGGDALMLGLTSGLGVTKDSLTYADIQDINTYIANTFPARDRWISYEYLCRQIGPDASATCQVMIDASLTPTATDRSDIIGGWTPDSVRADAGIGHLNQVGQDTHGERLVRFINSGGGGPPVGGFTGSLAAFPPSPAPGESVTFTATVTPAPALYKFRYSDGTVRNYAAANTATKTMLDVPLTVTLDVQNGSGVNTLDVAVLTVKSTPPPASANSGGFLPFFVAA